MSRDNSTAIYPNDVVNINAINTLANVEEEERPYRINKTAEPKPISTKNNYIDFNRSTTANWK